MQDIPQARPHIRRRLQSSCFSERDTEVYTSFWAQKSAQTPTARFASYDLSKRRSRSGAMRQSFSGVARVATGIIVHVFHLRGNGFWFYTKFTIRRFFPFVNPCKPQKVLRQKAGIAFFFEKIFS